MSRLFPDFLPRDLPLSREDRKEIRRTAWGLWWRNGWNIVSYLAVIGVYLLTVPYAADAGGRLAGVLGVGGTGYKLFRAISHVAITLICFLGGGAVLHRLRFAPCVYRATRRHGLDVCRSCGYWSKGLGEDIQRCPECGAWREPVPGS